MRSIVWSGTKGKLPTGLTLVALLMVASVVSIEVMPVRASNTRVRKSAQQPPAQWLE